NRVVPADRLLEETKAVARKIMEKSPAAIALAKACLRASMEMPLAAGLDLETAAFGVVGSTKDKEEGMRAFIEKRKPSWTGAGSRIGLELLLQVDHDLFEDRCVGGTAVLAGDTELGLAAG